MDTHYEVLILGGGTAGLTVASHVADRIGGSRLGIVEPSTTHYYQPLWTLVGGGIFSREESARAEGDLMPDAVTWIRDAVTAVDPTTRSVVTSASGMRHVLWLRRSTCCRSWSSAPSGKIDAPRAASSGSSTRCDSAGASCAR